MKVKSCTKPSMYGTCNFGWSVPRLKHALGRRWQGCCDGCGGDQVNEDAGEPGVRLVASTSCVLLAPKTSVPPDFISAKIQNHQMQLIQLSWATLLCPFLVLVNCLIPPFSQEIPFCIQNITCFTSVNVIFITSNL